MFVEVKIINKMQFTIMFHLSELLFNWHDFRQVEKKEMTPEEFIFYIYDSLRHVCAMRVISFSI